jgi:DNA gyrase subunit A
MKIIVEELRALREKHGTSARTRIVDEAATISVEDLIVEEDMVVTISHEGYIKRAPVALYRAQRRGGRGKIGATTRDEDFVEHLFVASTHSYLLVFTTTGKVYWLKVHEIPQAGRAARGRSVSNVLNLKPEEKLSAFLPVREFQEGRYLLFATRRGLVKKTDLMQYANPRPSGIIAIMLEENDEVIGVRPTDGSREAILSTRAGQAIRFRDEEARPMGRGTYGVWGMRLDEGDEVVALDHVEPGATLLAVSANGYGKRTEMDEYRLTRRGGKGIITMKTTDKTGKVVGVRMVTDEDQIMLVTSGGKVIRLRVSEIRIIGRNTQGVRLIDLEEGERVVSVARPGRARGRDRDPRRSVGARGRRAGARTRARANPPSPARSDFQACARATGLACRRAFVRPSAPIRHGHGHGSGRRQLGHGARPAARARRSFGAALGARRHLHHRARVLS